MGSYNCRDCERAVNRAEAHVRSVDFQQVAFCRDCWSARSAAANAVPEPRMSPDYARDPAAH
jgi:hypothetical protein